MNDLFADITGYALGWTLLHSLWQGALVFGLDKIALSFVPHRKSAARYGINCMALALVISGSLVTFFSLAPPATTVPQKQIGMMLTGHVALTPAATSGAWGLLSQASNAINEKITWIVATWFVGVLLFSARLAFGLLYIQRLKGKAVMVGNEWQRKVAALGAQLGIARMVRLAESIHVSKPLLLGYAKPMVLLPLGLLSGLPAVQVEAILLHELAHIKRHDFLVNLVQSMVEVVLFFNPFVWAISAMIRKEREHCCDDKVVGLGASRLDYIKALAQLEEANHRHAPTYALALNKNKFQVFNRIKRIMETSINQNQNKAKPFILVALIAVGLISASWLTTGVEKNAVLDKTPGPSFVAGDTIIRKDKDKDKDKDKGKGKDKANKKEEKSATYSRKVITTYDKDGKPHKDIIEKFEGDEELRPLLSDTGRYGTGVPAVPGIPPVPSVPDLPAMPPLPDIPFHMGHAFYFDGDSLPGHFFTLEDSARWEDFGREMEKRFGRFGDEHEEFGRMMEEWGDRFGKNFQFYFNDGFADQMEALSDRLRDLDFDHNFEFNFEDNLKGMQEHLDKAKERLKQQEAELKKAEARMKGFEGALQGQLIKDGYLKKGEKVESFSWEDGALTVNGIKIKEKDMEKYEQLMDQYLHKHQDREN